MPVNKKHLLAAGAKIVCVAQTGKDDGWCNVNTVSVGETVLGLIPYRPFLLKKKK